MYYRLTDDNEFRLWQAVRTVGEAHLAEIDRVVETYLHDRQHWQPVTAQELLSRLNDEQVIVLDVRPTEEYTVGHLPHARCLPITELEARLSELPLSKEIVAYCRGPYCVFADEAVTLLQQHGYHASRLSEGLPDWHLLGLPIETEQETLV